MRNRITYTLATLTLVLATFVALMHPVHAQTLSLDNPPANSSNSSSNGTLSLSSGTTGASNAGNTNLSSGFAPVSSGTTPPASGTLGSSGASNSTQTPSPLEACGTIWHPLNCMNELLADLANTVLNLAATMVTIAAAILSFSIVLTLHIKDFVDATPAIFDVWTTLRDVTSLFFIFFLLWAAFKIILGMDGKIGELIKNLVMAGILINFSFFFVGLMIDASNIVSQALYNAMVPASITDIAAQHIRQGDINSMLTDVTGMTNNLQNPDTTKYGIATIFINALHLSEVKGNTPTVDVMNSPIKIFFIAVVGIVIMFTAAASFILAAIAFIIRLVVLIFLLAVSPLWFASWIIPNIEKEFNFLGKLVPQLTFMPMYLLLMYVGLKVIAGSNMLRAASATVSGASGATNWIFSYIILSINFAIVILILNLPLMVALTMSGNLKKTKWLEKFDAGAIWKKVGSQAGSRTFGRAAYSLNQRITPAIASKVPLLGSLTNSALSKVSNAGFGEKKGGYEDRLKAKKKSHADLNKKIGEMVEERGGSKLDALAYQQAYQRNLEWKAGGVGGLNFGRGSGIIGFMVDNRANKQSAKKLGKDSRKEEMREKLPENLKEEAELEKQINNIESELPAAEKRSGEWASTYGTTGRPNEASRMKARLDEYKKRLVAVKGEIKEGQGAKKDKAWKDMIGDVGKEIKEDGGGAEKEEKKEEGGDKK